MNGKAELQEREGRWTLDLEVRRDESGFHVALKSSLTVLPLRFDPLGLFYWPRIPVASITIVPDAT